MHSLPPKQTVRAWAWDCGSAVPSLNRMGAACGLLTTLRAAQDFVSHYLSTGRKASQLCRQMVLNLPTALTPTSQSFESIGQRDYGFVCRAILQDHIKKEVAVRSMAGSVVL